MASEFWMKGQSHPQGKIAVVLARVSGILINKYMLTICVWPPVNSSDMLT